MKFVRVNTDGSFDDLSMNKPTKNIAKCFEKHATSKGVTELQEEIDILTDSSEAGIAKSAAAV